MPEKSCVCFHALKREEQSGFRTVGKGGVNFRLLGGQGMPTVLPRPIMTICDFAPRNLMLPLGTVKILLLTIKNTNLLVLGGYITLKKDVCVAVMERD